MAVNGRFSRFANKGTYTYNPDFLLFKKSESRGGLTLDKEFGNLALKAQGFVDFIKTEYDSPDSTTNPTEVKYTKRGKQWETGGSLQGSMPIGDYNYGTLGLEFKRNILRSKYDYATSDRERTRGGVQDVYSVYAQDEITFLDDMVIITPGARFDYWRVHDGYSKDTDIGPDTDHYESSAHPNIAPRIAGRVNLFNNTFSIRTGWGQAFRVASLNKLYGDFIWGSTKYKSNRNLDPEKSQTYELGFDVYLDKFEFSCTGYKTWAEDYITRVDKPKQGTFSIKQWENVNDVEIFGFEFNTEYLPNERWKLFLNYVYTDPEMKSGEYDGEKVTGIPLNKFSYGAVFTDPEYFTARIAGRHIGKIWYDNANTVSYGEYDVFDFRISRKFDFDELIELEPYFEVNNIFNVEQRETKYSEGPGRSFTVGLKCTF
jgi:outer membrane receptor protein involved in Fe transport